MDPVRWNRESRLFRTGDRSDPDSSQPLEPSDDHGAGPWATGFEGRIRLADLLAADPVECWRKVPGRVTFPWGSGPGGSPQVVVKRFERDLARDRWYERLRGRRRSPAQREFESLQGLGLAGLPVPAALGWLERGRTSLLVMGYVPHRETVAQRLVAADAQERRRLVEQVATLTARLHGAGWYHRDLYLNHFVLRTDGGGLVLLDLGRARQEPAPRQRWLLKDLGALLYGDRGSHPLSPREWLRGLAIYARGRGIEGRAARRELAAGALAFHGRISRRISRRS